MGVYKMLGYQPGGDVQLPVGAPPELKGCNPYFYRLERVSGLQDLEGRMVIDWGKSALAWHQWLSEREVIELSPPGRVHVPFRDYLEFTLTHSELRDLVAHAAANREWQFRLEAVGGVYLILATTTGQQYVGSATGEGGIWARWAEYARTGHAGNGLVAEALAVHSRRQSDGNPAMPRVSRRDRTHRHLTPRPARAGGVENRVEQAVTHHEIRSAGPHSAMAGIRPSPDHQSPELRISGLRNPVFGADRA